MAATTGLSAAGLLEVIDAGATADAAERGDIMLAAVLAELSEERRRELSLGQRDAWVLALRCGTFGDTLSARVRCPACGVVLSVRIPRDLVAVQPATTTAGGRVRLEEGPITVEARAPDGRGLAAAAGCGDVAGARDILIAHCVSAWRDGEPIDPLELDEAVVERIGEAIVAGEPQVEVRVGMSCASCGREWAPVLDIVQFLWRELSSASVQLLDEVHQLAIGYGWTEDQVLKLSSRRRRHYVERLAGG